MTYGRHAGRPGRAQMDETGHEHGNTNVAPARPSAPDGRARGPWARVLAERYGLVKPVGTGGMGRVWLAYDLRLRRDVAVKEVVVRAAAGPGEESREVRTARAFSEAWSLAALREAPHVVTVHDVVEEDGFPWIVMEFVRGATTLEAVVEGRLRAGEGPLSVRETARIGLAVLKALAAGHHLGIVHRDVKPSNILLAPDSSGRPYARVVLTDYGIAHRMAGSASHTRAHRVIGTPGYLAPEQLYGGSATPASDLFALGTTLYFAVEGREPFAEGGSGYPPAPAPPRRAGPLGEVLTQLLSASPLHRPEHGAVLRRLRELTGEAGGTSS
ncbi:serine/threonine-protein kinase [Streptomyces sp. NBC_00286]|uniref:serine/threonine-protein kinase n=1 Tax=Streptomyces sp. NBC_00286 TaxID=2975701 RepID=UPI002E285D03|nr:serine/threonine-protein kinase [Streptomyces sp. NBC_00286]